MKVCSGDSINDDLSFFSPCMCGRGSCTFSRLGLVEAVNMNV